MKKHNRRRKSIIARLIAGENTGKGDNEMSGGEFYYKHWLIDAADDIARNEEIKRMKMPELTKTLKKIAVWYYNVVHDLDYHVCCDAEIGDPKKFERRALAKLRRIVEEKQ